MAKLRFGAFLAPHHPVGEHPTLQHDFVSNEFWSGEHHFFWDGRRSDRLSCSLRRQENEYSALGIGAGVVSAISPSVHVAERMVQLDHLTNGRVIFGSGPGALTADARAFGIDPTPFRGRQDEALGVINRLLNGEHFKRSREAQLFDVCGRHLMLALPSLGLGEYLRVNDADA